MAIISDIGEGIKIIEYTQTMSSDYGTPVTTGSTVHNVTGYVVILNSNDEEVKSGILQVGDARGYFAPNDFNKLKPGNIVEYQGLQYEIVGEPRKYSMGGTADHIEVSLKRYHKP